MDDAEQPDPHLFMLCPALRHAALRPAPEGIRFRTLRRDELALWMSMPFDTAAEAETYRGFMQSFFDRVHASREELFFERCTVAVAADDRPIATAFLWPITQGVTTLHWLKVARSHEGRGIGRAIVSHILQGLEAPAPADILERLRDEVEAEF